MAGWGGGAWGLHAAGGRKDGIPAAPVCVNVLAWRRVVLRVLLGGYWFSKFSCPLLGVTYCLAPVACRLLPAACRCLR